MLFHQSLAFSSTTPTFAFIMRTCSHPILHYVRMNVLCFLFLVLFLLLSLTSSSLLSSSSSISFSTSSSSTSSSSTSSSSLSLSDIFVQKTLLHTLASLSSSFAQFFEDVLFVGGSSFFRIFVFL